MDNIKEKIEGFISGVREMIKEKEDSIQKKTVDLGFDYINKEECKRARESFEFLIKQENYYLEKKILESIKSSSKPLEELLKDREFRSEEEKQLFCKMYQASSKTGAETHTALIPFPLRKMRRVVVNGKPYLEIDKDGNVFMADGVGNK
jgi:hypothetical protein